MSDPIVFPSLTPKLGLPLLMAGQAQKEFFVNQALGLIDALHMRVVLGSLAEPPTDAEDMGCYRVAAPASGAWTGQEDCIAVLISGQWTFISPSEGMQIFDRAAGHSMIFRSIWEFAAPPTLPSGGTIVDSEARTTIAALIQALQTVGVLGPSAV